MDLGSRVADLPSRTNQLTPQCGLSQRVTISPLSSQYNILSNSHHHFLTTRTNALSDLSLYSAWATNVFWIKILPEIQNFRSSRSRKPLSVRFFFKLFFFFGKDFKRDCTGLFLEDIPTHMNPISKMVWSQERKYSILEHIFQIFGHSSSRSWYFRIFFLICPLVLELMSSL